MDTLSAFVFVLWVYLLTLFVSLFVVLVIIALRRITADRPAAVGEAAQPARREEARA